MSVGPRADRVALFGVALAMTAALSAPGHAATARAVRKPAPDFTGNWDRYPNMLMSPFLPNQPKAGDPLATPQAPPPPLKAQYMDAYRAAIAARRAADARNEPIAARSVECLPDGMPNVMRGAWVMEIIQTPKQINISQELYNQTRRVYMGEALPALDDYEAGYYGRSVGHFEGDSLVIETIGIRDGINANGGGADIPHSPQMKIVERIRYVASDIIHDELTITDPVYLDKPWVWVIAYKRLNDYKIQEYVCEANREYRDAGGVQRRADAEGQAGAGR